MASTQQLLLGEGAGGAEKNYIEDVFSTWLYTGSGSGTSQTITNNIDLSTEGGLVWGKVRTNIDSHYLFDTVRGVNQGLSTNSTAAQGSSGVSAFTTTGFTVDTNLNNTSARTFASWTFRKQPKFFDVVTFTAPSSGSLTVNHSLGSDPGCIIIKRTDSTGDWLTYHRSTGANKYLLLNGTAAATTYASIWPNVTSTSFEVTAGVSVIANGTYVAYLFAHDAGGFGLTGTDNVISCGSYTCDGSGNFSVNLGWEPQWILYKRTNSATSGGWFVVDNMRGMPATASSTTYLQANTTAADATGANTQPNATGFSGSFVASAEFIYIAIRRGPMKVPTDGATVFQPVAYTGTNVDNRLVNTGIVTDMAMSRIRTASSNGGFYVADRLRGDSAGGAWYVGTGVTDVEGTDPDSYMPPTTTAGTTFAAMNGFGVGNDITRQLNQSSTSQLAYAFRRAPSFFDEVCYFGTNSAQTLSHNLGVAPELIIVKCRASGAAGWPVYSSALGANKYMLLNSSGTPSTNLTTWNNTAPTSTVFSVGSSDTIINASGSTYVSYLFATCPGVSKVGSFTHAVGAPSTDVNCGFAAGARFVMIKSTAVTTNDDWYVWDTARGIISGNEPYLRMNLGNVEVTTSDGLIPYSSGFTVNGNWLSGGTYIFLAIA